MPMGGPGMTAVRQCAVALMLWVLAAAAPAQNAWEADPEEIGYSRRGADTCYGCHGNEPGFQQDAMFLTPHGHPKDDRSPFGPGQLQCEACHGPGGAHTSRVRRGETRPHMINFGEDELAPVEVQNGMCLNCHETHIGVNWDASPHGSDEVSCAGCHQVHIARDPVSSDVTQPDVCYACHQNVRGDFLKFSSHPVREAQMSCTGCHSPHGSMSDGLLVRNNLNETCYTCHAELRGPFLWEHAPVPDDCSNCHRPHGSNHPAMLQKRGPLLCQSCHAPAGHPSIPYTSAGLPSGTPNANLLSGNCMNCHMQVHGSNHPSGAALMR